MPASRIPATEWLAVRWQRDVRSGPDAHRPVPVRGKPDPLRRLEQIVESKGRLFAGCTVAMVTPFRDGEVDFAALRRAVDWQVSQGATCLSPAGTTGEAPTLTHHEHEHVISTVVEHTAGRCESSPARVPVPPPRPSA